ncbi:MAG: hypothetical protein HQ559_16325, partial [Lentisphaerae bacterium]|nr:hypothetical protein [Lentisphaerota bacterium]
MRIFLFTDLRAGITFDGTGKPIFTEADNESTVTLAAAEAKAKEAESAVPEFNEKLISSVELSGHRTPQISMELIEKVLAETEIDLLKVDARRVFPITWRSFAVPIGVMVLFTAALLVPTLRFGDLVRRVAVPLPSDATVGKFSLAVLSPGSTTCPEGDALTVAVRCSDRTVTEVSLHVQNERLRRYAMLREGPDGVFRHTIPSVRHPFTYWAGSEKVASARHYVELVKRPALDRFEMAYSYPEHTGLPSSVVRSGSGAVKAYRGTEVVLSLFATKPLEEMIVEWMGERASVTLDAERTSGKAVFQVLDSGTYTVHLKDVRGLSNLEDLEYTVVAEDDNPPRVRLDTPDGDLYLEPEDSVDLGWTASDDFGIVYQELRCAANGGPQRVVPLDPQASTWTWVLETVSPRLGEEIRYWIRVHDSAGAYADSNQRHVSLVRGHRLKRAGAFLTAAQLLDARLSGIAGRMASVERLYERIEAGSKSPSGEAAGNLAHNATMMRDHKRWLTRELTGAEMEGIALKGSGFFARSRACGDLMSLYFRQERLFTIPGLLAEEDGDGTFRSIATMLDLTRATTIALDTKAREQVPWLQSKEILRTVKTVGDLSTPASVALRRRLGKSAAEICVRADSPFAADWRSGDAGSAVQGLRSEYYAGTNVLFLGRDRAQRRSDRVRTDTKVVFANAAALGAEEGPFAVTWSGFIRINTAGSHRFVVNSDDACVLLIDGSRVLGRDGKAAVSDRAGNVSLQPGLHSIHLAYANFDGDAVVNLRWHAPGRPAVEDIPAGVLFVDHPDAFRSRIELLTSLLGKKADEYRELDRLAGLMRKELKTFSEQVDRLTWQMEKHDRPGDWSTAHTVADDLRRQADSVEDPVDAADLELAAEAVDQATDDRNPAGLRDLADAVSDLDRHRRLGELASRVDEVKKEADRTLAPLSEASPDTGTLRDALARIADQAQDVRQTPMYGDELNKSTDTRAVHDTLASSERSVAAADTTLAAGDLVTARTHIAAMSNTMQQAAGHVETASRNQDEKRKLARKTVAGLTRNVSERVGRVRESLRELPDRIGTLAPENATEIAAAEKEVKEASAELKTAARRLANEARIQIADEKGDAGSARDKLALAADLEKLREERVDPAAEALSEVVRGHDVGDELSEDDETLGVSREQRLANLAMARKHAALAATGLDRAEGLVKRFETGEDKKLSDAELADLQESLRDLAEERLDSDMVQTLDTLERLRESGAETGALAEKAKQLEKRAAGQPARDLADDAAKVRDELARALSREGEEAFAELADDVLRDARKETQETLDAARALEMDEPPSQPARTAPERASDLSKQIEALEDSLARADGARELLGEDEDPVLGFFESEVKPKLTEAANLVAAGKEGGEPLARAIEGLKSLDEKLDSYPEEIGAVRDRLVSGSEAEASAAPLVTMNEAAVRDSLDKMQNLMIQAETAAAAADELEEELRPLGLEAGRLLDEIPMEDRDATFTKRVEQALEKLPDLKVAPMAAELNAVAATLTGEDEELKKKMLEAGKALRAASTDENQMNLARTQADAMSKQLVAQSKLMEKELAGNEEPAAQTAMETLEEMKGNLARGDFEEAKKNLDAVHDDVRALSDPASRDPELPAEHAALEAVDRAGAEPGDGEAPGATDGEGAAELAARMERVLARAPELRLAGDEEADWHARRGLMEAAGEAIEQGDMQVDTAAAIRAAAEGDYERAAAESAGTSGEQFQKAARTADAIHEEPTETPRRFKEPRRQAAPELESVFTDQAATNRAELVDDTKRGVRAARKSAGRLLKQVKRGGEEPAEVRAAAEDLAEMAAVIEAARDALGETDFEADRLMAERVEPALSGIQDAAGTGGTPAEAGESEMQRARAIESLREVGKALERYEDELEAEEERIEEHEEVARRMGSLSRAVEAYEEARDAAESAPGEGEAVSPLERVAAKRLRQAEREAEKLDKLFEERGTVAAQRGREALEELEAAMGGDAPRAASPSRAVGAVEEAVALMDPAGPALSPQLNEDAEEAIAGAVALENEDAIKKALQGDFGGAAESMNELAEALPEGVKKEKAEASAKDFLEAEAAQAETLPAALAEALEKAEPLATELASLPATDLERAADAVRAEEYPRASEYLHDALESTPRSQREPLDALNRELEEAARAQEREEGLSPWRAARSLDPLAAGILAGAPDGAAGASPIPEMFSEPRRVLEDGEEEELADKALEDRGALANEGLENLGKAQEATKQLAERLSGDPATVKDLAKDAAAVAAAMDRVEAVRSALGDTDHDAHRAMEDEVRVAIEKVDTNKVQGAELTAAVTEAVNEVKELQEILSGYEMELTTEKEKAEEHEKVEDSLAGLMEAVDSLQEAEDVLAEAGLRHADAVAIPSQVNLDHLSEAEKEATQEAVDKLDGATPLEQADQLARLAASIEDPDSRLKKRLREAVEEIRNDPAITGAVQEVESRLGLVNERAEDLGKQFDNKGTVAARRGKQALKGLEDALGGDSPYALEPAQALQALGEAVDLMKPAGPEPVGLNKPAVAAAARAGALDNEDALNKALQGDYGSAAESMKRLADVLPDGAAKELAKESAQGFGEAEEEQVRRLPEPLAAALKAAEPLASTVGPAAGRELERAADAARARDYPRASEHLQAAANRAPAAKRAPLAELGRQLDQAALAEEEAGGSAPWEAARAIEEQAAAGAEETGRDERAAGFADTFSEPRRALSAAEEERLGVQAQTNRGDVAEEGLEKLDHVRVAAAELEKQLKEHPEDAEALWEKADDVAAAVDDVEAIRAAL